MIAANRRRQLRLRAELASQAREIAAAIESIALKTANANVVMVTPNQVAAVELDSALTALRENQFHTVAAGIESIRHVRAQPIDALAAQLESVVVVVVRDTKPTVATLTRAAWRALLQPQPIGAA